MNNYITEDIKEKLPRRQNDKNYQIPNDKIIFFMAVQVLLHLYSRFSLWERLRFRRRQRRRK